MSGPLRPVALASPEPERGRPVLGCDHARRPGNLDETARRLPHDELGAAHQLVSEGHDVKSMPERARLGTVADLEVCGRPVEVKSFLPLAERPGGPPTPASVCNKLLRAARQADVAVLWSRGSGLAESDAREGIRLFAAKGGWERISSLRVLGDGFDLTSGVPSHVVDRGRGPARQSPAPRRESPELGLGL